MLDAALRQVAEWYARGLDLTVAVNVSAANLLDEGWATDVARSARAPRRARRRAC